MTGTLYLGHGPYLTLQRDFLILLPLMGILVFLSESSLTFLNALAVVGARKWVRSSRSQP
jgi:hypothetical protein